MIARPDPNTGLYRLPDLARELYPQTGEDEATRILSKLANRHEIEGLRVKGDPATWFSRADADLLRELSGGSGGVGRPRGSRSLPKG